jgi:hypothetical protein
MACGGIFCGLIACLPSMFERIVTPAFPIFPSDQTRLMALAIMA